MNVDNANGNVISNNSGIINIEDPKTKILFYEREIYFLKQQIELKDKEIEARDRDIDVFKMMFEKMDRLEEESQKSHRLITELYERKIEDLKRTLEILQSK